MSRILIDGAFIAALSGTALVAGCSSDSHSTSKTVDAGRDGAAGHGGVGAGAGGAAGKGGADSSVATGGTSDASVKSADASTEAAVPVVEYWDSAAPPLGCGVATDGGAAPETLAYRQVSPAGIQVDGERAYWANAGAPGSIMSCPLTGCGMLEPFKVGASSGSPYTLAINQTRVYWTTIFKDLFSCPLTGCGSSGPEQLAAGKTSAVGVVLDASYVYWTNFALGTVDRCPLSGCTEPTVLFHGPSGPGYGVVLDATSLYFLNNDTNAAYKMPLSGVEDSAVPTTLATGNDPTYLTKDSSYVYWTESSSPGRLMRAPLAGVPGGGAGTPLVQGLAHPYALAVDPGSGSIYFAVMGDGDANGSVMKCVNADCAGGPVALATGQGRPEFVAIGGSFLYWTNSGTGTVCRMSVK